MTYYILFEKGGGDQQVSFHNLQKFCTVTDLESPEITSCPIDVTMDNSPGDCFKAYTYKI